MTNHMIISCFLVIACFAILSIWLYLNSPDSGEGDINEDKDILKKKLKRKKKELQSLQKDLDFKDNQEGADAGMFPLQTLRLKISEKGDEISRVKNLLAFYE